MTEYCPNLSSSDQAESVHLATFGFSLCLWGLVVPAHSSPSCPDKRGSLLWATKNNKHQLRYFTTTLNTTNHIPWVESHPQNGWELDGFRWWIPDVKLFTFRQSKNLSILEMNTAVSSASGPPVSFSAFDTDSLRTYEYVILC